MGFIFDTIRLIDLIDILLVAFLIFQVYKLVHGTVAIKETGNMSYANQGELVGKVNGDELRKVLPLILGDTIFS